VRRFRAHEWHHIAVDWNDSVPSAGLQVYIDFEKVQGGGPYLPLLATGDMPTAWVRLNCRRPRDGLFIGGFIREQGVADAGVFKWFTNSASASTGGGAYTVVDPDLKRLIANATIDELITFTGTFPSVRSYYSRSLGYFSVQPGEYSNVFEVPLPPEVDFLRMRSFDWTSYYPAFITMMDGTARRVITQPISCQVFPGRGNIPSFPEPWRAQLRNSPNPVANKILMRRQAKTEVGIDADLVYQFRIQPGKVTSGPLAGGSVESPVIDDVTLTYYLADPKILIQEDAD